MTALGMPLPEADAYTVRHFAAHQPPDAPPGFHAILRERVEAGELKTTWKYRRDDGCPAQPVEAWKCPLKGDADSKEEVDVLLRSDGEVKRALSRSCSIGSVLEQTAPAGLARGCTG